MRVPIAARKSNQAEGGKRHSPDTQDDYSRALRRRPGWEIVGVARDTVSGRLPPIDRALPASWGRVPCCPALPHGVHARPAHRGNYVLLARVEVPRAAHHRHLSRRTTRPADRERPAGSDPLRS